MSYIQWRGEETVKNRFYLIKFKLILLMSFMILIAFIAGCSIKSAASVTLSDTEANSFVPKGYELKWQDEFDGTSLNTEEWNYRNDSKNWSYQKPENVSVSNGKLKIDLKKEDFKGMKYTGGGIISKRNFKYGYYEISAKLSGATGGHSIFDLSNYSEKSKFNTTETEIDGVEVDGIKPNNIKHTVTPLDPSLPGFTSKVYDAGFDTSKGFHKYGIDWNENQVIFYVDGVKKYTADYPKWYHQQGTENIWISCIASNQGGTTKVDDNALPGEILVDYVRYYEPEAYKTNVAYGSVVKVDSMLDPMYNGQKLVDGDRVSDKDRWIPLDNKKPHWAEIDLGKDTEVGQIKFWAGEKGYNKPIKSYILQYKDGNDWKDIVKRTNNTKAFVDEKFNAISTRYIRLYIPTGDQVKVYEIKAFSKATAEKGDGDYTYEGQGDIDTVKKRYGNNAIIIDTKNEGYKEYGEGWNESKDLFGYKRVNRPRYNAEKVPSSAQWTPNLKQDGNYDVYIYRAVNSRSDTNAKIDVMHDGTISTTYLNYVEGSSDWVYLGTWHFAAGTEGYVTNTRSDLAVSMEAAIRTDAVMFVNAD